MSSFQGVESSAPFFNLTPVCVGRDRYRQHASPRGVKLAPSHPPFPYAIMFPWRQSERVKKGRKRGEEVDVGGENWRTGMLKE